MSDGTENTPPPDVTAVNVSLVPLFLIVTSAPGTTPPAESTTTPETEAVEEPWAKTPTLVRHARSIAPATPIGRCVIASLLEMTDGLTKLSDFFFPDGRKEGRVLDFHETRVGCGRFLGVTVEQAEVLGAHLTQ